MTQHVLLTPWDLFLYGLAIVANIVVLAALGMGLVFIFYSCIAPPKEEPGPEPERGNE